MNRSILVGRLTKDPELRYTTNGIAVTRFTLAVNQSFKSKNGERKTDFINIVVWRKQAENVATFLGKGAQIAVDGRIQTGNYEDATGKRIYTFEIVADTVSFLSAQKVAETLPRANRENVNERGSEAKQDRPNGFKSNNMESVAVEVSDDDLPF